jgi:hypothetical protein
MVSHPPTRHRSRRLAGGAAALPAAVLAVLAALAVPTGGRLAARRPAPR